MGPVIDPASLDKILSYIQAAESDGATVLLDGRTWSKDEKISKGGNWIGPTILLHASSSDKTMREEVFGPVLSIYECKSWEEAIQIENASEFGNAASIYTTNGANAEWFTSRFRAGMLGVNIGKLFEGVTTCLVVYRADIFTLVFCWIDRHPRSS